MATALFDTQNVCSDTRTMRRTNEIQQQWEFHVAKRRTLRLRAISDAAEDVLDPQEIRAESQRRVAEVERDSAAEFAALRRWTASQINAIFVRIADVPSVARSLHKLATLRAEFAQRPALRPQVDAPPPTSTLLRTITVAPRAPASTLTAR